MRKFRQAGAIAVLCLAALLAGCGKDSGSEAPGAGATADQIAQESANTDLEQDSAQEMTDQEEIEAATDLFMEDGDVCTQFMRLSVPDEWKGNVNYHYFQDPDTGRYALDVMESSSMTATEGTGGLVFSIVLYDTYPEERGMESAGYLGMLKNEEGEFFYVFLETPGSGQYTEGSEEAYTLVLDTQDRIAGNMEGRNGYKFEAGKDPVKPEEETDE